MARYKVKKLYRKYKWTRLIGICVSVGSVFLFFYSTTKLPDDYTGHEFMGRKLLYEGDGILGENSSYPRDLFSPGELRGGAVFFHFMGLLYMFLALNIICDEFFVPSLEVIIEKLELTEDVAGATFMAAGGSAPELFTSLVGVFVAKTDVGIGTIVGSAVFNILFVIGCCSFASKVVLQLTWWPLFRDVCFYSFSLVFLIIFFSDSTIEFYEAAVLFGCYLTYVTFMKYNERIESFVKTRCCKIKKTTKASKTKSLTYKRKSIYALIVYPSPDDLAKMGANSPNANNSMDSRIDFKSLKGSQMVVNSSSRWLASTSNILNQKNDESMAKIPTDQSVSGQKSGMNQSQSHFGGNDTNDDSSVDRVLDIPEEFEDRIADEPEEMEEEESKPLDMSFPASCKERIYYIICFPITFLLWVTMPDVRRPERVNWFFVSFFGSIVWIAAYSYIMVWMAATIGEVFNIPQEIMGLTVLAAGTSIPDLITSVIVAKKGFGDMAVSSSVGSNIFDITVGLPIPWMLWSASNNFEHYPVSSKGLFCSICLLLFMLLTVVTSIACSNWRMSKKLGLCMMGLYLVFVGLSVSLEKGIIVCPDI